MGEVHLEHGMGVVEMSYEIALDHTTVRGNRYVAEPANHTDPDIAER